MHADLFYNAERRKPCSTTIALIAAARSSKTRRPVKRSSCRSCGKEIGAVVDAPQKVAVDPTEELIRRGTAARCTVCQQAVEIKGPAKTLVPHYAAGQKKMCPGRVSQRRLHLLFPLRPRNVSRRRVAAI